MPILEFNQQFLQIVLDQDYEFYLAKRSSFQKYALETVRFGFPSDDPVQLADSLLKLILEDAEKQVLTRLVIGIKTMPDLLQQGRLCLGLVPYGL